MMARVLQPKQLELVVSMWSPRLDSKAVADEAVVAQAGPVPSFLQLALGDGEQTNRMADEVGHVAVGQRPDGLGGVEVRGVSRQSVKLRPNHILAGEVRQSRGQVDADIRLPIGFPYHHSLLVSVHRLARGNSDRTIRVGASASILSVIQGSMKMPSRLAESIVVGANRYSGAAGSVQGAA
jgi:hypothetical protein